MVHKTFGACQKVLDICRATGPVQSVHKTFCACPRVLDIWPYCSVRSLSRVQLFLTPWTAAHQAPPSMGFSRQEYWVPSPSPYYTWHCTKHLYTWICGGISDYFFSINANKWHYLLNHDFKFGTQNKIAFWKNWTSLYYHKHYKDFSVTIKII